MTSTSTLLKMKIAVLVLGSLITTTMCTNNRNQRNPYEEVLYSATAGYGPVNPDGRSQQTLTGVMYPEYEQNVYELVQNADMVCCITVIDQNGETVEIANSPCIFGPRKQAVEKTEKPAPAMQPNPATSMQLADRKVANIFRQVLSETILKIVESLLNTFEDPAPLRSSRSSKRKPADPKARKEGAYQLPYPFDRMTGQQQSKGQRNGNHQLPGQPLKRPDGELVNSYDCYYL